MQQQMPSQVKTIADTAQTLANDNVEICANYIQKLAVERVGADMDKKLAQVRARLFNVFFLNVF